MLNKNNKTEPSIDNRKTFISMFCVIIISFVMFALTLFQIPSKTQVEPQLQIQSQLQNVAKQLGDKPSSQEERKAVISTLENLTSEK